MKKLINANIIILVVIIIFSSCSKKQNHEEFFAWMDAYLAVEKGSENTIAITLFFEKKPFDINDVSNIEFTNISNEISISRFDIEEMDNSPNKKYSSYVITLYYIAKETGYYDTSGVDISFKSNKTIEYTIGKWDFDVCLNSFESVNSWESPVASTDGKKFPYDYALVEKNTKIKKIYYGKDLFLSPVDVNKGVIDIADAYSSPIVYIKSKIIVSKNGKDLIDYGKGCYCGAINFSEDVLKESKDRNGL